jgi:hypothetical protein
VDWAVGSFSVGGMSPCVGMRPSVSLTLGTIHHALLQAQSVLGGLWETWADREKGVEKGTLEGATAVCEKI